MTSRTNRVGQVGAAALLVLALTSVAPGRATAASDGANGRIALVDVVDGNTDIYTIKPDGTDKKRLTTNDGIDTEPAYSADGRQIVFVRSAANSDTTTELWIMNADGSGQKRLATEADGVSCPDLSPDGRRVAFSRLGTMDSAHQGIWVLTRSNRTEKRLAPPTAGYESCPVWSPDGKTLAFTRSSGSDVDGPRIWTMRANGTHRKQLTRMGKVLQQSDETPDWSPDGRYLLFTREVDGTTDYWSTLWKIRGNGTGLQQLTRTDAPGGFTGPAVFSPDGTQIAAYCKNLPTDLGGAETGIFTLRPDGAGQQPILVSDSARAYAWQPLPLGT